MVVVVGKRHERTCGGEVWHGKRVLGIRRARKESKEKGYEDEAEVFFLFHDSQIYHVNIKIYNPALPHQYQNNLSTRYSELPTISAPYLESGLKLHFPFQAKRI